MPPAELRIAVPEDEPPALLRPAEAMVGLPAPLREADPRAGGAPEVPPTSRVMGEGPTAVFAFPPIGLPMGVKYAPPML